MTLFPKGPTVLDRPKNPKTETQSKREIDPEEQMAGVASAIQDSFLVVIENPIVNGYTGLVLAQHFQEKRDGERYLNAIHYIRIDQANTVKEMQRYDRLIIKKGFDNIPYEFIVVGNTLLPTPSSVPYKGCFLDPAQYEMFHNQLDDENLESGPLVELMYELLAAREPKYFSLDRGGIKMPPNYASLRPSEIRLD